MKSNLPHASCIKYFQKNGAYYIASIYKEPSCSLFSYCAVLSAFYRFLVHECVLIIQAVTCGRNLAYYADIMLYTYYAKNYAGMIDTGLIITSYAFISSNIYI